MCSIISPLLFVYKGRNNNLASWIAQWRVLLINTFFWFQILGEPNAHIPPPAFSYSCFLKKMFECAMLEDHHRQPQLCVLNYSPLLFWLFIDVRNVFDATWCKTSLSNSMPTSRWTFCSWNTPPFTHPRPFCICIFNLFVCLCMFESNDIHFCVFNYYPSQMSFCKGEKKQFNIANYKMKSTINNSYLFPTFCLFTRVGRGGVGVMCCKITIVELNIDF